jgi:DNA polymerase III delta prime subunit
MKLLGPQDSIEIDGSHATRGDVVTKRILQYCSSIAFSGVKICFIDEADNMPRIAQEALRKVIEDYSDNVRFLLAACDFSKINPGIRSRLTEIPFDIAEADRAEIEDRSIRRLEEKLSDAGICYERAAKADREQQSFGFSSDRQSIGIRICVAADSLAFGSA